MRKRGGVIVAVTVVAGVLLLTPIGRVFISVVLFRWQVQNLEAAVTAPGGYEPAAVALAKLCQSDPSLFSDHDVFRPAWSPPELTALKPSSVDVDPDGARVEFGGGFHHFGYILSLDKESSTDAANMWVLSFYSEGAKGRMLQRFSLDKSERLSPTEFVDRCMAEYHRRASDRGKFDDRDVRARLKLLLKHEQDQLAVDSVRDFAARYDHDWPDQLLVFLIDVRREGVAARQRLEAWAEKEQNFSRWLLAAYAYDHVGDMPAAERCVRRAVAFPPDDPSWLRTHARHRGAPMCIRLYEAGRYEACVMLCDSLLGYAGARKHLEPELKTIRDRARHAAQSSEAPPVRLLQDPFDPFETVDVAVLCDVARHFVSGVPATQPR